MFKIDIKIEGLDGVKKLSKEFEEGLYKGFKKAMLFIEGKAKKRFDTPGNLHVRTGHYRRSINTTVRRLPSGLKGTLAGNVKYAAIHEYGGTILPRAKTYLRFPIDGKWVSTKKVIIPKRPLLTPSITENLEDVGVILTKSIIKETE